MILPPTFISNSDPVFTFSLENPLGQGKFSTFKISHNNKKYALKLFPADQVDYFKSESRFQVLSHPRLLTPVLSADGWVLKDNHKEIHYALLTEYCQHGDLYKHIIHHKITFDEKMTRTIFKQVVSALEYLHNLGIGHLDVKPENIMIDKNFHVRLGDFDIAFMKGDEKLNRGTTDYHAPELLKTKYYNPYKADIYSLGITLFCVLTGGILPFKQKYPEFYATYLKNREFYWSFIKRNREEVISEEFVELFEGMVEEDPDRRFGLKEIKESKWFNGPAYNDDEMTQVYKSLFKKR